MPTVITEGRRTAEFLASEANGSLSREQVTLLSGQNLKAGSVLGQTLVGGVAAAVAAAGNVGNGAMGAIAVTGPAKNGTYMLTIVAAAANGGNFVLEGPDGVEIGAGKVAVAFAGGGLAFTLADGATDFAVGDTFSIKVSGGIAKYKQWNPANNDGSQVATAILYANVDASAADHPAVIIAREAEVNNFVLEYFAGAAPADKAAAAVHLAKRSIIVR